MSVKVSVDVLGLRELEKALKSLGSEVAGKNGGLVRTALMAAALPVLRSAQVYAEASRDTGKLAEALTRSRQSKVDPDIDANEAVDVGLFSRGKGKKVFYGKFLEFGTSRQPAQPFLRQALESNVKESTDIFRKKLATGIERVAKKIGNKNAQEVGARIKKL